MDSDTAASFYEALKLVLGITLKLLTPKNYEEINTIQKLIDV